LPISPVPELAELAQRVLHSATHANRYSRKYGAQLAQAVLAALDGAASEGVARGSPDASQVRQGAEAAPRGWLSPMAELCELVAAGPDDAQALLAFAAAA